MKHILLVLPVLCFLALPARAAEDLTQLYKTYEGDTMVQLDEAHRGINELSDWISDVSASALQFTPAKTAEKLAAIRPLFSENGYKAYQDFLTSMGFSGALASQSLAVSTIVERMPMLMGQGASAGRYAWAFELPVVMTVAAKAGEPAVDKRAVLRIQFGRSAKGAPPHGLLIENWQEFKEAPPAQGASQQGSGQPATTP